MEPVPALPALPTLVARPQFTVGGAVGRTFSTWWRNLLPFAGLSLLANGPYFAFMIWTQYGFFVRSAELQRRLAAGEGPYPAGSGAAGGIVMLFTVLFAFVQVGALTYGAIQHLAGRRVTFGALVGNGLGRAWRVFATGFLAGLVIFAGVLLLVIPGIIAGCAVIAAIPAAVAEPIGAGDAVKRSFALTKGRRLAVFGAFLVMAFAGWAISMAGSIPGVLAGAILSRVLGPEAILLGTGLMLLVFAVAAPLWTLLPAVVYHDLRVEKEGVDTAELAKVFE